jgi:hypothetical protein
MENVGEMNNKGWEVMLGYGNFSKQSDFKYNIGLNLSAYKNKLVKISERQGSFLAGNTVRDFILTRSIEGQPISAFFGHQVEGIFQNAAEVDAHADQGFDTGADGIGRFKYADINNDNLINDLDRTTIGSPHPTFTYGLNLSLGYKNFDVSAFFQGSQGNDIYNYTKVFSDFPSFVDGGRGTNVLDSWSETNTGATLPALSRSVQNNETSPNTYFVEDGSYLRLKNLQIGYTLPENLISKISMTKARFYIQGTNLFTITDYTGIDPEIGSIAFNQAGENLNIGIDYGTFPITRTLTVGLRVNF